MRIILAFTLLTLFACGGNNASDASGSSSSDNASSAAESGDFKKEITKKLDIYIDKMMTGDYEAMLDLTYPKLFDIAPRSTMLAALKQAFNAEGMKITFSDPEILKVHDKNVKHEGALHTLVDYKMTMHMALNDEMAKAKDFMIPSFNDSFGKENVEFVDATNTFNIKMNSQMIAIKEKGNWYFMENRKEQKAMLQSVLGEKVLSDLGI